MAIASDIDYTDERRKRREARRRQVRRRRLTAVTVLTLLGAASLFGLVRLFTGTDAGAAVVLTPVLEAAPSSPFRGPLPEEIRGVHVTMALTSIPGRLDKYIALKAQGLNTIEVDVKDENGEIAFSPGVPLAGKVGAAKRYYNPREISTKVHAAGLYLIGRVVTFEDPILSAGWPSVAIRRADGSRWLNNGGLGWTNPYDKRVWRYNVQIATAAAKAGFDEIQFDYVRFPSDGDISQIRYPGTHGQPLGWTIPMFAKYAAEHLHPLGVRISTDVFGLSATRDLGIGQFPRRISRFVDSVYPMVYPSHYVSGEYNIEDPDSRPGTTVAYSLRDFRRQVQGGANLIPWLQDFSLGRQYSLADVRDEIQAARLEHSKGFMLWNAAGVYTDGALATPSFR